MALIDRLAENFELGRRNRGSNYFDRGAVDILRVTHRSITATVQGEKRYVVNIDWDGGLFEFQCTCDDYVDHQMPCKHIWAALLEANKLNRLPDEESLNEMAGVGGEEDDDLDDETLVPGGVRRKKAPPAIWKRRLNEIKEVMSYQSVAEAEPWPTDRAMAYIVDIDGSLEAGGLQIDLASRTRRRDGQWERPKLLKRLLATQITSLPDAGDQQILQMLIGAERAGFGYGYNGMMTAELPRRFRLNDSGLLTTFRMICETGRCFIQTNNGGDIPPLQWDNAEPWQFVVEVKKDGGGFSRVEGFFRRGDERMSLRGPDLILPGGLLFVSNKVGLVDDGGAFELMEFFARDEKLAAPAGQERELLSELFSLPRLPKVELPADFQMQQVRVAPRPVLKVRPPGRNGAEAPDTLYGELSFDYAGELIASDRDGAVIILPAIDKLLHRDMSAERQARARLMGLGFRSNREFDRHSSGFNVSTKSFAAAVRILATEGWRVEAEGRIYRTAGSLQIEVSSGIDWFEVHGGADFDGQRVSLPQLLTALRKGETTVTLADGTIGILPEDWLQKYGLLATVGTESGDHLEFKKTQAGLLDAMLAARPEVVFDVSFNTARQAMMDFEGIGEQQPPETFVGELRPYQKEGLGWLSFLRQFGFGGCLADDMGLGKTVQILAMLEQRRLDNTKPDLDKVGPSLVVVPRSLVFNWNQEANKFAPKLKLLDHTGPLRSKTAEAFANFDVILTTYGTLRNDATFLKDLPFDYVVLDEAQAIKNAASESAKAARLLRSHYRLALSGTPVQNHLGELWSLFEFLNPGMLGASNAFSAAGAGKIVDDQSRMALARALRPFILRRTKGQVAKELPQRLEQTIFCDLDANQRKMYDELRAHYRQALLTKISADGIGKSRIMILEALLRLRQAACHPGLIDKSRVGEGSAKIDTLISRLIEVQDEGHKALVFSQFTSLLAIVKAKLDEANIVYEYLDGKTRDRDARVQRFQTDDQCKLFLVSLKAGGVGLNLTAAEYVFLLDPWWNPAVEAQAIDRAHRIGQTRQVFAYRLITRDTVEQKVLDLQQTKRDLADAVITADNRTMASLSREDLELLLS